MSDILQNLVSGIENEVGTIVTSTPQAKSAISAVQDEIAGYRTAAYFAAAVAAAVVLFYYVPRFESPVPRIWRRRR